MGRSRLWNRRQQGKVWGVPSDADGAIYWKDYPLAVSGFNAANASDWTISNPDADTLRILLADASGAHGITHLDVAGLFMVIPTPISSLAHPGVSTLSSYRTTCGISIEWDWTPANVETMGVSAGFINVDGSSGITDAAATHRVLRRTVVNGTTTQSTVADVGVDSGGQAQANVSTTAVSADTIGTKVIMGGGGRTVFNQSYDWKDASYNRQESNFGSNTSNKGSGFFNIGETWDAGTDSVSSVNYYFFIALNGNGSVADNAGGAGSNIVDVKRIRYFVRSIGDWRY